MFNRNDVQSNYTTLVVLFCVCFILTNTVGHKLVSFPGLHIPIPSAYLVYPFTFVLSDVINEVYGNRKAAYMVRLSFFISFFTMIVIRIVLVLPAHPYWFVPNNSWGFFSIEDYQSAFNSVFQINTTIVLSSMGAFLLGQFLDIFLYSKIKIMTGNRCMWLRTNTSTILSQLVDTLVVSGVVLFYGLKVDLAIGLEIMLASYLFKVVASIVTTPIFYITVFFLRSEKRFIKTFKSQDS